MPPAQGLQVMPVKHETSRRVKTTRFQESVPHSVGVPLGDRASLHSPVPQEMLRKLPDKLGDAPTVVEARYRLGCKDFLDCNLGQFRELTIWKFVQVCLEQLDIGPVLNAFPKQQLDLESFLRRQVCAFLEFCQPRCCDGTEEAIRVLLEICLILCRARALLYRFPERDFSRTSLVDCLRRASRLAVCVAWIRPQCEGLHGPDDVL